MGNVKKLLNKPLKTFIVFTCLVLACSIPVYFQLIESIWMDELDDHNGEIKKQIQAQFNNPDQEELDRTIALWNKIQSGSHISAAKGLQKDSTYVTERNISDNGVIETERFRGLSCPLVLNNKPYHLVVETNVEEVHETVLAISVITGLFMGLLIAGFVLLNRRLSKRIWTPFTDTIEKLKRFDLNSGREIHFAETDISEFAELNEALKKLIAGNLKTYQQQKEFTQNASHELQTPLALLKTKVDLLIQDPSLSTEQRKIIESLDSAVLRVSRINKNLLLLAGIENRHYGSEIVNLSTLLRNVLLAFGDAAAGRGGIDRSGIQDNVEIEANESLVEILISNLLSNALKHGMPDAGIAVTLTENSLTVSNAGDAPLNVNTLFKRFISASADKPGTGLGLAIIKEVCDKYGWRVTYDHKGGRHFFTVIFRHQN